MSSEYIYYYNSFISCASGLSVFEGPDYLVNPSNLNYIDSTLVSFSVSPLKFEIPELSPAQLFIGKKINQNLFSAISLSGISNKLFSEISGSANLCYGFGEKLYLGASLEYSHIFIKNYASEGIFLLHLGALLKLNDILTAGFTLNNSLRAYYSGGEKTVNQVATLGIGIRASNDLYIDLDAHINLNNNSGFSAAFKYLILDFLALRVAYLTNPAIVEGGAKLNINRSFSLALNVNYHNFLGFSQRIMLNYLW